MTTPAFNLAQLALDGWPERRRHLLQEELSTGRLLVEPHESGGTLVRRGSEYHIMPNDRVPEALRQLVERLDAPTPTRSGFGTDVDRVLRRLGEAFATGEIRMQRINGLLNITRGDDPQVRRTVGAGEFGAAVTGLLHPQAGVRQRAADRVGEWHLILQGFEHGLVRVQRFAPTSDLPRNSEVVTLADLSASLDRQFARLDPARHAQDPTAPRDGLSATPVPVTSEGREAAEPGMRRETLSMSDAGRLVGTVTIVPHGRGMVEVTQGLEGSVELLHAGGVDGYAFAALEAGMRAAAERGTPTRVGASVPDAGAAIAPAHVSTVAAM